MKPRYKIEKGIPLPKFGLGRGRRPIYRFGDMAVGDSFAFPTQDYDHVIKAMVQYKARHFPKNFHVSKKSLRCWRLEDKQEPVTPSPA